MSDLRLSEIWVYPIKSLGGIRLQQAEVREKGLVYDRRWMLVDANGTFMTQRVTPAMAFLKLMFDHGNLIITHSKTSSSHSTPLKPNRTEQEQVVTIWNDSVKAFEVNKETSQWFSNALGVNCKLVSFPEENERAVDPNFAINDEHVSLADAYPFLTIGQSTLDFLNTKLKQPLPMNRFRPNFVFTGGEPHEEDSWRNFTIGSNRFVGVKPCARCIMTTINQDTAEKGDEPLRTLNTYRKRENKILFGQNLLSIDHQQVKEGDIITIQTRS